MKDNSIVIIQDRSKKIQSMTQFSASTQRDLLFSMNSNVQSALTISREGTAKALEITETIQTFFETDLEASSGIEDESEVRTDVGGFPSFPAMLLDINSVFQEIKTIQDDLSFSFGKYMQKSDELVKELGKKIEQAGSLNTYLSKLEGNFKTNYLDKESYKYVFGEYFKGDYSGRLTASINNYKGLYGKFTDALLRDDTRLRQLKMSVQADIF